MKTIKRISAILLVVLIFALSLPTATVFAADSDMRYGRTKLSGNMQKLYDKLVICYSNNTPTEITIDKDWDITAEQLHYSFKMFYSDYPEYFWVINGDYSWSAIGDTVVSFKPKYAFSNVTSARSTYNSKVTELTKGLEGKSDYEKSKIIHDRLIDTVTYVSTNNDQNAYGALVEGKAVCNGYARAYQHLMNEVGIPTWYVSGTSINPGTNQPIGHAWNLVKIDGKWYYTDVTWDDQIENTFYEYLNITTSKMEQGHTLDSDYAALVPRATATAANYYKVENREFTKYDQAKLVKLLKKDNNKTQIYINGDVNDFLNSVDNDLAAIAKKLGATGGFQIYFNASTLQNAAIINVIVISEDHTHRAKTSVKQVNATCLTNGTKNHYVCECGLKFWDSTCTNPVLGDSELVIPAIAHTPSGWKSDATCHWKECINCGSEIANSRGNFTDKNKDNKCDTCGYSLPVADENGNVVIGSGTTSNKDNDDTNNIPSGNSNPTTSNEVDISGQNNSNENTDEPTNEEDITDEIITETEEIIEKIDSDNDDNSSMIWIIIGSVAVVAIGITLVVLFKIK